ncbi:MAG: DUF4390 domain-containing protein [Gammaproteobacteria bacterium]|nr:DUF4390 domain-containing protein [Gammaproteobacteria bacterium]
MNLFRLAGVVFILTTASLVPISIANAEEVIAEHIVVDEPSKNNLQSADRLSPQVKILNAQSKTASGRLYVSAEILCQPTEAMFRALSSGVPLDLVWHLEVKQDRKIIPKAKSKDFKRKFNIKFHTLTRRYVVHEQGKDFQRSFSEFESVLSYLNKIHDWNIMSMADLNLERDIEMQLRVALQTRSLPKPLSTVASIMGDKNLNSERVKWKLTL